MSTGSRQADDDERGLTSFLLLSGDSEPETQRPAVLKDKKKAVASPVASATSDGSDSDDDGGDQK